MAIAATVVALTGCVGDGRTEPTVAREVSEPIESTTTPTTTPTTTASPIGTVDAEGDAAAAEFTRSLFKRLTASDPGCTVAVGRSGNVVFAEAFGAARLDPLEPMTIDTVVDIGSVSKQFTATAILLLAERGAVDLDAPLSTYLPDLPAWASRPTIAQLIHHQSGIPEYLDLLVDRGFSETGKGPTIADALAALGDVVDLRFAPGTSWEYSNSNYFLLSQVVQSVTGDDLPTFLTAEVFEPLGLEMVMDPMTTIDGKAVSYSGVAGQWQIADVRWAPTIGAGSIQTTPSELVEWAAQYWEPTIGASTINAERFDTAIDTHQSGRSGVYGAGMFETDMGSDIGRVVWHPGGWGGFRTLFSVAPAHRLAIAVSCNSPTSFGKLRTTLDRDLFTAWIGSN
jgi:CubicO group peptidase (beta-lactamase class C family)